MVKQTVKKAAKKSAAKKTVKYIYSFGAGKAEGNGSMKELLGGKGANLAEMSGTLKLPVPPGFTITTEVCTYYWNNKRTYPKTLQADVETNLKKIERETKKQFGSEKNPLLVSVRSGARASMPGMMETILNIGLTEKTIPGMIAKTGDPRFVYDAYRRLIMMYSDVVMEKAAGIEPKDGEGIRKILDGMMGDLKKKLGVSDDTHIPAEELIKLCAQFKATVKKVLGSAFPDDPMQQLWGAIGAVFASWNGKRAIAYRNIENIPHDWGTAVNVQTMVFGNMGETSATGVAFTRNPGNGDSHFYGEYLINAQGEDVVAGIRTPSPMNRWSANEHSKHLPTLEKTMPKVYKELDKIQQKLEKHFHDMLDIEFTIEDQKLWMLQCRVGKRNGTAAVQMALDMVKEKLITQEQAVLRVTPAQLGELLLPAIDPKAEAQVKPIATGLPAGPGGACGKIVFNSADAIKLHEAGKNAILVREETNPEDIEGMRAAAGILTQRGGMTSHAALVARGWGKCCIVGCGELEINLSAKTVKMGGKTFKEGDELTLNGTKGWVYNGALKMLEAGEGNKNLVKFLALCDKVRVLKVRANADTPEDAANARKFGAEGIGLFRIEHMFYGKNSDKPLFILRKMILSASEDERKKAVNELFPFMKAAIKDTIKAMAPYSVTVRLMDPPLHEFVPTLPEKQQELAKALGISMAEFKERAAGLHEVNPMMGHRGIRLGVTYPEITRMQARAIFEAAAELLKNKVKAVPEVMIPLTCDAQEIVNQKALIREEYDAVVAKTKVKNLNFSVGTMIEIPRAAVLAYEVAQEADFFSFGTNDLTQMTFGFSRDDIGAFLPEYLKQGILEADPFQTLDQRGVGMLIEHAVVEGREAKPNLKIGICGEHGGDPESVEFCHREGFTYVSCSAFRVPIARLAAAQAAAKDVLAKKKHK
ncbi:MAG: pyruvate, phosphate dikinase [Elusimicrobiaceae bacterium]|uniref:pyruvate, phosphate dikinase n=1 Tax=Candidatus Avelusimicrobium faecicola TaxID=3416205 RepID=UPI002A7DF8E9|nr:pyruvate, phosphate dikinase [Spirochaetota bacterium]MDY2940386.1 pyruvate, phosphate dikinase [Elusimicrobiaceae bacterium]